MAHLDALQETAPSRHPLHHPVSVLRLTREPPLPLSAAPSPSAHSPLHHYHPPPKQVFSAGPLPFRFDSPNLLHEGLHMTKGPLLYCQQAAQATDHTWKDCSYNDSHGLHQIVPLRRVGGIPICRITNPTNRQVTFSKRCNGLLKKAYELSVLCDVEVGVIIFSASGRLSEFVSPSTSMPKLLEGYQNSSNELPYQKNLFQEVEFWRRQVFLLRDLTIRQKDLRSYMLGENLVSLDLIDIEMVEQNIKLALDKIRVQKAQLIQAKAEESKRREARLKAENDMLKRKLYEVVNLHAWKEGMLIRNDAPKVPCPSVDVMRSSMHDSSPLAGEKGCLSPSSTFINQDIHSPLMLQPGLQLFPTRPSG